MSTIAINGFNEERVTEETRRFRLTRETRQGHVLVCVALWSVISFLLFSRFLLATVVIQGESMSPTLHEGDRLLLNRLSAYMGQIDRGDVVVLQDRGAEDYAIKRVVGLPNDHIRLQGGQVYVNGHPLREGYLPSGTVTEAAAGHQDFTLSSDLYFVLGDNRRISEDSRYYGPVRRAQLLGVVVQ